LFHLYCIIDNEVHELIETPDSPLNSNRELLIKPYLDGGVLLKKLENEIDGRQQNFAPTSSSTSIHLARCRLLRKLREYVKKSPVAFDVVL